MGVIIGLGIYFRGFFVKSGRPAETAKEISEGKTQVPAGGRQVEVGRQVKAEVIGWDSSKKELAVRLADGKENKVTVDSGKMMIFIPQTGHKTQAVIPVVNGDKNWATAFCPQDTLTIGYDGGGGVVLLFNNGYRMCGLKGGIE